MLLNILIFISVLIVFSIIGKNSIYLMLESNSSVQNSYLTRATHRGKLSHIQGKQSFNHLISGQLPRRICQGDQGNRSYEDFAGLFLRYGCCADHLRDGCCAFSSP